MQYAPAPPAQLAGQQQQQYAAMRPATAPNGPAAPAAAAGVAAPGTTAPTATATATATAAPGQPKAVPAALSVMGVTQAVIDEWQHHIASLRADNPAGVPAILKALDYLQRTTLLSLRHSVYLLKYNLLPPTIELLRQYTPGAAAPDTTTAAGAAAPTTATSIAVQQHACGLIANLLCGHWKETKDVLTYFVHKTQGLRLLLDRLQRAPTPQQLANPLTLAALYAMQAEAARALWNCTFSMPPIQLFVMQNGGLTALLHALQQPGPNVATAPAAVCLAHQSLVTQCVGALWALCNGSPDVQVAFLHAHGMQVVTALLQRIGPVGPSLVAAAASAAEARAVAAGQTGDAKLQSVAQERANAAAAERRLQYVVVCCLCTVMSGKVPDAAATAAAQAAQAAHQQAVATNAPNVAQLAQAAQQALAVAHQSRAAPVLLDAASTAALLRLIHHSTMALNPAALGPPPADAAQAAAAAAATPPSTPMAEAERAEVIIKALEVMATNCLYGGEKAQSDFANATVGGSAGGGSAAAGANGIALLIEVLHTLMSSLTRVPAQRTATMAPPPRGSPAANAGADPVPAHYSDAYGALARTALSVAVKKACLLVVSVCSTHPQNIRRFVELRGVDALCHTLMSQSLAMMVEIKLGAGAALACVSTENPPLLASLSQRGALKVVLSLLFQLKDIVGPRQMNFMRMVLYSIATLARRVPDAQLEFATPQALERMLAILARAPTTATPVGGDLMEIKMQIEAGNTLLALATHNAVVQQRLLDADAIERLLAVCSPVLVAGRPATRARDVLLVASAVLQLLTADPVQVGPDGKPQPVPGAPPNPAFVKLCEHPRGPDLLLRMYHSLAKQSQAARAVAATAATAGVAGGAAGAAGATPAAVAAQAQAQAQSAQQQMAAAAAMRR